LKPGRKFIESGPDSCSDAEILAIIIGSGGPGYSALDCANAILEHFGTLPALMDEPIKGLTRVRGISTVKSIRVAAAYELACRIIKHLEQNA
jgi:DNA repair protein RadC